MAEMLAIKVSGHTRSGVLRHSMKSRNGLTWTILTVLAGFIHTEIPCMGKMQIFIRCGFSSIHILHI